MIDHNGDEAFELYAKAHQLYARQYPTADYPSAGGEIEAIDDREFVVLANSLRTLAAYEIKSGKLTEASDGDFDEIKQRREAAAS